MLNYLIKKQLSKRGENFFIDLRAAFDSVNREVLVREMRKRRVSEGLVVRCEEVLRETRHRVRQGGRVGERIWSGGG